MKTVNENPQPPHVFRGHYESPEKKTGVFDESIMDKMELEATMGLYRKGAGQLK